jgi:hypothetical protein
LCREASMALGDCSTVSEDQRGQLVGGAGGEHVFVCCAGGCGGMWRSEYAAIRESVSL